MPPHRSHTDHGRLNQIPRPAGRIAGLHPNKTTGLAFSMKLVDSPSQVRTYCEFIECVVNIVDAHRELVTKPKYKPISEFAWSEITRMAIEEVPILSSYEKAWPVRVVVNLYVEGQGKGFKRLLKFREWGPQFFNTFSSTQSHNTKNRGASRPEPRITVRSSTTSSSAREPARHTTRPRPFEGDQAARRRSDLDEESAPGPNTERTAAASPSASSLVASQRSTTATQKDCQAVADFLSSLTPTQAALMPVFTVMGISDKETLFGLSAMDERDAWMYSWVKEGRISEFQFAILKQGLNKMHRPQ